MQTAILAACFFLLLGFVLRATIRLFQTWYIPASVAGGLFGLGFIQLVLRLEPQTEFTTAVAGQLRSWPGPLLAVIFAGLLLERPARSFRQSFRGALSEATMVWIIILGEIALGLLATWLLVLPYFDVPASFGQLIEAGFAGGHGTSAALGEVFAKLLDFDEGMDLGFFIATAGLLYSVISGIIFINIAIRRGWTRADHASLQRIRGTENRNDPQPMALARVRAEVIDPFAFQILMLALAFGIGVGLQYGCLAFVDLFVGDEVMKFVGNLPLFLFTLLGGLLLRHLMQLLKINDLIDPDSIKRLLAIAIEFLIVAAIASLRVEVIATYLWPLLILLAVGFVWTGFCLFVLARRLLPAAYWFELGILNYGMSTGTTAQGMMLLRIVDRDLDTGAAEDYALAAPLSAPFIGGGVLTFTLPLILIKLGIPIVAGGLIALMFILYAIGRKIRGRI